MSDQPQIGILPRQAAASREASDLPGADALCRQILWLDPANAGAVRFRLDLASGLGRPEDAFAVLDAAWRADPTNPSWPLGRPTTVPA
jgi:hypothetical protein